MNIIYSCKNGSNCSEATMTCRLRIIIKKKKKKMQELLCGMVVNGNTFLFSFLLESRKNVTSVKGAGIWLLQRFDSLWILDMGDSIDKVGEFWDLNFRKIWRFCQFRQILRELENNLFSVCLKDCPKFGTENELFGKFAKSSKSARVWQQYFEIWKVLPNLTNKIQYDQKIAEKLDNLSKNFV